MSLCAQRDYLAAGGALRRFVSRRIGEGLEVVLVRAVVDVHLGLERVSTFRAILPIPGMLLIDMVAAKRVTAVIPTATVPSVGKQLVVVLVVANPIATALGLGQVLGLSAQTAPRGWLGARRFCWLSFSTWIQLWPVKTFPPAAAIARVPSLRPR